jgi:CheY-like chemotaxis protein
MPDIDGLEVGRQIHAMDASARMILFTLSDPWGLEAPARKVGFVGVISKSEPWKLLDSIKELAEGFEGGGQGDGREHGGGSRRDPSVH